MVVTYWQREDLTNVGNFKQHQMKRCQCQFDNFYFYDSDMGDVIVTLICNTNITLCAGCPDNMNIIVPDVPLYTAGDELTCTSNGYPAPTYSWTVDNISPNSSTNTQALQEGEHHYVCTATVTINSTTCSDTLTVAVTTYSKYQKQEYVLWNAVSVPSLQFLQSVVEILNPKCFWS